MTFFAGWFVWIVSVSGAATSYYSSGTSYSTGGSTGLTGGVGQGGFMSDGVNLFYYNGQNMIQSANGTSWTSVSLSGLSLASGENIIGGDYSSETGVFTFVTSTSSAARVWTFAPPAAGVAPAGIAQSGSYGNEIYAAVVKGQTLVAIGLTRGSEVRIILSVNAGSTWTSAAAAPLQSGSTYYLTRAGASVIYGAINYSSPYNSQTAMSQAIGAGNPVAPT